MTDIFDDWDNMIDVPEPHRSAMNQMADEIERLREENERLRANAKLERLLSFQHGVRSVYEQARHEGQDDLAQWIECRYPLVTANTQEMRDD